MGAGLTLNDIKRTSPKLNGGVVQLSDLMTEEEKAHRRAAKEKIASKMRKFDQVDAYSAEILARFGYEVWKDWNSGALADDRMRRMVYAERARDEVQLLDLETILVLMVGAAIRRHKGEPKPKGPKEAQKIVKDKIKRAKGG